MGKVNDKTDFFKYVDSFAKDAGVSSLLIKGDISSVAPAVTIAIPTYKRPEFIKCAIDSALAQKDFDNYEVVVVDNDPERGTETEKIVCAIDNPKLRYYKNGENLGMFGNMNRCILLSRTKWISFLHDDDLLSANFLFCVFDVLKKHSSIDMLCARQDRVIFDGNDYKDAPKVFYHKFEGGICRMTLKDYAYYYPVRSTGCVFCRDNALKIGGFNPDFYPTSDYVFSALYSHFFSCYDYNRYLYDYRIGLNESANPDTYKSTFLNDYFFQIAIQKQLGHNSLFFKNIVEANTNRNIFRLAIYGIHDLSFAKDIISGKSRTIHKLYVYIDILYRRCRKFLIFLINTFLHNIK